MRERLARRIRFAAAAGAFTVLVLAGGAGALSVPPPYGDPPAAPAVPPPTKTPKPCNQPLSGPAGIRDRRPDYPQPLCGTSQADVLTATRGGGGIWGYQGNDTLMARNGAPDEVFGGRGRDTATLDRCDSPAGIEQVTRSKRSCNGVSPLHNAMFHSTLPGPNDYPAFLATLECGKTADGGRMVRFLEEPELRAVDVTDAVDWQTVAWSALVFRWDGAQWQFYVQSNWRWDRTYDMQVQAFPGNYWRLFDGRRTFLAFFPDQPGMYRLAVRAHWYATPRVPTYDTEFWAGAHYGPFEDPTQTFCDFPS
jgi:hypothetical protein